MTDHYYAVIMAGGGGTRLWPLSRLARPKQMLNLLGDRTLYQMAIDRLDGLFDPDHILVVTVADQARALHESRPEIPIENFLIEPSPRGTASVVGLGAVALQQRDPESVMAVLTSDHFIRDEELFRNCLQAAYQVAQKDYLVTLGIHPTYPATGYGYIQRGELIGDYSGFHAFDVLRFKEKPSVEQAKEMLAGGDHAWNSGMFIWQVEQILEEFNRQMPELAAKLRLISADWQAPTKTQTLQSVWSQIKPQTIDYGIMEHAQGVAVLAAELGWNDVGSWDSLFEVLPRDPYGNIVKANHLSINTENSLVYHQGSDRLIVTIGVDSLVIVDTGDVLLVCKKSQAQLVKQIVDQLKKDDQSRYI